MRLGLLMFALLASLSFVNIIFLGWLILVDFGLISDLLIDCPVVDLPGSEPLLVRLMDAKLLLQLLSP